MPDLYIDDELKQKWHEDFKNAKDEVDLNFHDEDEFDKQWKIEERWKKEDVIE